MIKKLQESKSVKAIIFYIKASYNSLNMETNLAYMPQDNTYYDALARNSYYAMQSGGWQSGLKALWDTKIGLWSNALGYSLLETSIRSDSNHYYSWYGSAEKNWSGILFPNGQWWLREGEYGNDDTKQHTLEYKSDFKFDSIDIWKMSNNIKLGFALGYVGVQQDLLNCTVLARRFPEILTIGQTCGNDNLGLNLCSMLPVIGGDANAEQYASSVSIYRSGKADFNIFNYGI